MDFPFKVSDVLKIDEEGFVLLDGANFTSHSKVQTSSYYNSYHTKTKPDPAKDAMREILDKMGEASSKAQGLKQTITSYIKFVGNNDHRIYMQADEETVYGFIKVGPKNLFHRDHFGNVKEIRPLCVLDFYVHESVQRHGIGKAIFERMLECENVEPRKLAIDRPSPKLISFLKKHYGLVSYVPQNNNYVVFNAYWDAGSTIDNKNTKSNIIEETKNNRLPKQAFEKREGVSDLLKHHHTTSSAPSKDRTPLATRPQTNQQAEPVSNKEVPNKKPIVTNAKEDPAKVLIEQNIKSTENSINDCQEKIKLLNEERMNLLQAQDRRNKEFHNKAPWAGHADHFNTYKTSNSYGSHYSEKQPLSRHGK